MIKGYDPTGRVRYLRGTKIEELANGSWQIAGLPDAMRSIGAFDDVVRYWTELHPIQARAIADQHVDPQMIGAVSEQRWVREALVK